MSDRLIVPPTFLPSPSAGSADVAHLFAEVLVPRRFRHTFTYSIPVELQSVVRLGSLVEIPFGSTRLHGVVIGFSGTVPPCLAKTGARAITKVLDDGKPAVTIDLLDLSRQVSDHYLAPWGQCLRLILTPVAAAESVGRYSLTNAGRAALAQPGRESMTRRVLARLGTSPQGLSRHTLARHTSAGVDRTLAALVRKGWVEWQERPVRVRKPADPPASVSVQPWWPAAREPVPSSPWWNRLRTCLESRQPTAFLLEGSPSARLAPILLACHEALSVNRAAILIAPEIARASSISALAKVRWGDKVEELHSGLTVQARRRAWRRIGQGQASVVVGTRAAVFAPLIADKPGSLGLLCVDAEEDASLKDEQEPRYHARDVARLRAEQHGAVLLLASAHASVETLSTLEPAAHHLITGTEGTPAPVQVVDQRQTAPDLVLSPPLVETLRSSLQAGSGAVLYLNRKGFASALFCRDCGAVPQCPNCTVALRYYSGVSSPSDPSGLRPAASRLRCLYCGRSESVFETCPVCHSSRLHPIGFGTARLEEEVRRRFPHARIGRLDADTARRPADAARLWRTATVGGFDVLIGTQMLFGGPPLPKVGLVGIPYADAGLHVPDFRSAERTYHGLIDATRLARSAEEGGAVILQTYLPSHHAITAVQTTQPSVFYEPELAFRKATGYPPFSTLISLRVSGTAERPVQQAAEQWARLLAQKRPSGRTDHMGETGAVGEVGEVMVLGPVPSPVSRIRGRYRWQILVRSTDGSAARETVRATLEAMEQLSRGLKFEVDVDPTELI